MNSSTPSPTPSSDEGLPPALAGAVSGALALVMVGMGATVAIPDLLETLRNPKQVYIGLVAQWLVMPFTAWAVSKALDLSSSEAVGLILIGCCPGGTASNLMAFAARADMTLGIGLTLITNLLSVGSLPLLLLIYTSGRDLDVPYDGIALSMLLVVGPICIGLAVRHYRPQYAVPVTKIGSVVGFVLIGGGAVVVAIDPGDRPVTSLPWELFVSVLLLLSVGFAFGAGVAFCVGFGPAQRLTVSFETGVQNSALAIALVALNFEEPELTDILYFPVVYGSLSFVVGLAVAAIFRQPAQARPDSPQSNAEDRQLPLVTMSSETDVTKTATTNSEL